MVKTCKRLCVMQHVRKLIVRAEINNFCEMLFVVDISVQSVGDLMSYTVTATENKAVCCVFRTKTTQQQA